MKVRDLNSSVKRVRESRIPSTPKKDKLRNVLSIILGFIERFEISSDGSSRSDREKIDVLKGVVSDMVKDEDQKKIIRGGA
ncbi:MAG: hypothetical protein HOF36_11635 [Candidatus Marinimicrobia bacterium]|nr:hypothetical protein [Candidatus Neomarinimicrobiota bacterium]